MTAVLEHLLVEDALPAVLVTLNRPEQRNALSTPLMRELTEELERQSARPEVRAIVLRANGPAFSAGHDLRELVDRTLKDEQLVFDVCTRMMETIQRIPQPVIAAVRGIATAAGCQLVATCDLAIAAEEARFATPGVRIGLFCSTPMVAVSRSIGRKRALEMLLTGRPIDAHTAAGWGLVNRVVPAAQLEAEVKTLAQKIASGPPLAVRAVKRVMFAEQKSALERALEAEVGHQMKCFASEDCLEGVQAFFEKRAPRFRGR